MRMVSIASGSSGNCIYIGSDSTHLLVDAGISNKRIQQGLNEIGLTGNDVNGILITHEHSDHIKGLGCRAGMRFPYTGPGKPWMRLRPRAAWANLIKGF